jgi:hypothetical protein
MFPFPEDSACLLEKASSTLALRLHCSELYAECPNHPPPSGPP